MNESNPPSQPSASSSPSRPIPPPRHGDACRAGENSAEDSQSVTGWGGAMDAMLRRPARVMHQLRGGGAGRMMAMHVLAALGCALVYGLVVGMFAGGEQLWAAPLKVAAGMAVTALICLPSLYIFSCLAGSTARVVEIVGMVGGLAAVMMVLLLGFAPVAWVFSQSTASQVAMGCLHLMFLAIATVFGLRFLSQGLGFLGGSRAALKVWMMIFVVVMLQMTAAVRPLIGTSETLLPTEKKFFLAHWLDEISRARMAAPDIYARE